jgi:hypothetical protein
LTVSAENIALLIGRARVVGEARGQALSIEQILQWRFSSRVPAAVGSLDARRRSFAKQSVFLMGGGAKFSHK